MARRQHSGVTDQRKASIHRMEDARVLFRSRRWRGAMYLAGYAVECRLKYKLMQKWNCFTLDELEKRLVSRGVSQSPFTHNLDTLTKLTGARDRIDQNPAMSNYFSVVSRWQPAWRYSPDLATRESSEEFLRAGAEFVTWIENNL